MFDDMFVTNIFLWRKSQICVVSFSLTLSYYVMEIFSLFILSFARLMIVLYPFDSKFKSGKFVIKLLTFGLLMCLLFTGSFGILIQIKYLGISNNLCLPFMDPSHTLWYCRVITTVLTILHFVTLITTIGLNINLVP